MNKRIKDLAYKTGMCAYSNGNQQAVNDFALYIINDVLEHIDRVPTQQLTATTYDLQLVTATKQQITKHVRTQYGLTSN
jgi:hypothetical protein